MAQPKKATLYDIGQAIIKRVQNLPQVKMPGSIEPDERWRKRVVREEEAKRFIVQERAKTEAFNRETALAFDKHDVYAEHELLRYTDELRVKLSGIRKQHRSQGVVRDLEAFEAAVVDLHERVSDPELIRQGIKMLADIYGMNEDEDEETAS